MGAEKLGVAVVGVGGAVATTAIAGIEMIKAGSNDFAGLPLASRDTAGLPAYRDMVFGGWDLDGQNLADAARTHGILSEAQLGDGARSLARMKPWRAAGNTDFCRNVTGGNTVEANGHRAVVEQIRVDLDRFKTEQGLSQVVMVNLASTERPVDADADAFRSVDDFERGLDRDDREISPAMLYAYAAIESGVPYGNFAPSVAADIAPLAQLATTKNVPIAGKDGKTGQTLMKTVIAPALRDRALYVEGWFSTNILGNRDGLALHDSESLKSKLGTKGSVLDQILGYHVEDHIVDIRYYRPRGDDKEAWDNIDIQGFLGQRMQIKVNFLCKDSVLAAPLAIEIARVLGLAQKRGQGGVQEQMGLFFKAPQTTHGRVPEHAFAKQVATLDAWLAEV